MTPASSALRREVGFLGAMFMGLGSILGTGVFVSLGIAAGIAGPHVVSAVALAALLAIANGLSSAQLAAAHPVSGGTYEYGYRYIHPHAGFAAGWMFLLAKSASAATAALGFAGYTLHALGIEAGRYGRVGLALTLVLLLTLLVAGGVKRSNQANLVIVSLTLITLTVFVVVGSMSFDMVHLVSPFDFSEAQFNTHRSLLHATALMFVAYTGYGRIATLGEEVREPEKTIPRAIIGTLILTMVLYLSVALVAVGSAGADSLAAATQSVAAPLEVVARGFKFPLVARLVALGAVTAMAGVLLNLILGLSRVLFAMGRRRDMPAWLEIVQEDTGSPTRAVGAMGVFIAGLVCIGDVRLTWSFAAFSVLIYYGLTNLAALRLPPQARRFPRVFAYAGLLGCLGLTAFIDWRVCASGMGLLAIGFVLRAIFGESSS